MALGADLQEVADIHINNSPKLDAWLFHFSNENNIEYLLNPSIIASPEQLRFMVALKDNQLYIPSSDEVFFDILYGRMEKLHTQYQDCWKVIEDLVASYNLSKSDHDRIISYCRYKYNDAVQSNIVLPSRFSKRLVGIVISQCGQQDPYSDRKFAANAQAQEFLHHKDIQNLLYRLPDFNNCEKNISSLQKKLTLVEIKRLMTLGTLPLLYRGEAKLSDAKKALMEIDDDVSVLSEAFEGFDTESKKYLFVTARVGWVMFDLALAWRLVRSGHQVVMVVKDDFYFNAPVLRDLESDPVLQEAVKEAFILDSSSLTKNELLQLMREHRFLIISDGTSEQLNLCRANVTFARAWKECDMVIASGRRQKHVLMDSSHEFTRDILCFWRDKNGEFHIQHRKRAEWVKKFAEKDLVAKAGTIISAMKQAKSQGQMVMFYSAIIGSIPGQTKVAISLVNAFVAYLRDHLDNTFIINPAEHFIEGMDGDDLMYMWELVQRSGLLDVWRFQTFDDIEKSFGFLNRKVPASWLGKDSTFSTGCTKEMKIALDVQREDPELQIIGPPAETFFRRRDYGIGKYYDASISG